MTGFDEHKYVCDVLLMIQNKMIITEDNFNRVMCENKYTSYSIQDKQTNFLLRKINFCDRKISIKKKLQCNKHALYLCFRFKSV